MTVDYPRITAHSFKVSLGYEVLMNAGQSDGSGRSSPLPDTSRGGDTDTSGMADDDTTTSVVGAGTCTMRLGISTVRDTRRIKTLRRIDSRTT